MLEGPLGGSHAARYMGRVGLPHFALVVLLPSLKYVQSIADPSLFTKSTSEQGSEKVAHPGALGHFLAWGFLCTPSSSPKWDALIFPELSEAVAVAVIRLMGFGMRSMRLIFQYFFLERNCSRDRKSTRLNSSHRSLSRMPSSA